jgi:protein arginine kinase activator
MLCQICGKTAATVHYTEMRDNKMSEIHACERCAEEKGLHKPPGTHKFDIAELLADMVDSMTTTEEERVGHVQCPSCGLLYSQFRETGRVGCAECYNAFKFQLRPLLRRIHGSVDSKAKHPVRSGGDVSRARHLQRLHDELQRLVEHEEFERAAAVRDQIRKLQAEPPAAAERAG